VANNKPTEAAESLYRRAADSLHDAEMRDYATTRLDVPTV